MDVLSNTTIYELRFLVGKEVGGFLQEISLCVDKKPIDNMLNGYTLRQANITEPITVECKVKIERVGLTDHYGKLTQEAQNIFRKLFTLFSTDGLMSKQECQKFHQRCVGDSISSSCESKVEEIYETYDADKDGNLDMNEFIRFYETSCKSRESTVWRNLEMFGIRPDLKLLDDVEITHVDGTHLIRHLLVND